MCRDRECKASDKESKRWKEKERSGKREKTSREGWRVREKEREDDLQVPLNLSPPLQLCHLIHPKPKQLWIIHLGLHRRRRRAQSTSNNLRCRCCCRSRSLRSRCRTRLRVARGSGCWSRRLYIPYIIRSVWSRSQGNRTGSSLPLHIPTTRSSHLSRNLRRWCFPRDHLRVNHEQHMRERGAKVCTINRAVTVAFG
jgi:hypothetical protein